MKPIKWTWKIREEREEIYRYIVYGRVDYFPISSIRFGSRAAFANELFSDPPYRSPKKFLLFFLLLLLLLHSVTNTLRRDNLSLSIYPHQFSIRIRMSTIARERHGKVWWGFWRVGSNSSACLRRASGQRQCATWIGIEAARSKWWTL